MFCRTVSLVQSDLNHICIISQGKSQAVVTLTLVPFEISFMRRYQTNYFIFSVLTVFLFGFLAASAHAAPNAFTYVSPSVGTKQLSSNTLANKLSIDSWKIKLNTQVRELEVGDSFEMSMPNGDVLSALIKTNKKYKNGDVQLQANFGNDGHVILTIGRNATFGSITSSTHNYSLSIDDANGIVLIDLQTLPASSTDLSHDMVVPQALNSKSASSFSDVVNFDNLRTQAELDGETDIDVLFLYSPEFRQLFTSPETRINQLIAFSNASFQSTDILINMRMAGAVEVAFDNDNANSSLLNAVSQSTGDFADVSQMRDDFGADLVAVLGASSPNSASGIAFVLNRFNSSSDGFNSGYSVTRLSTNCCDAVFTHEIGHNLGSGHEGPLVNPNANISRCNGGFTGFSCGHGNTEPEGDTPTWGTIMSNIRAPSFRDPDARAVIGFRFSNLDNTCVGEPCGIAPDLSGPEQAADNRTSFNMSRILVGGFRDPVEVAPDPDPDPTDDCSFFVIDSVSVICL